MCDSDKSKRASKFPHEQASLQNCDITQMQ